MEWLSDICEGMILNFMSYARGDFSVKTARTGLRDNQIIIPLTVGPDSRGIIAESCGGSALPLWIPVATMEHIATDCTAWNTSYFCLWRVPAGELCLKRQVSRDFLCKNSGQAWVRFLFTAAAGEKKPKQQPPPPKKTPKTAFSTLFPKVLTDESDKIH